MGPPRLLKERKSLPVFLLIALLLLVLLILTVLLILILVLVVLRHEGTPPFGFLQAVAGESGTDRLPPYRRYFCRNAEKYSTEGKNC